ncbi:hypothetical protein [Sodalis sp. dw_96]|uniref:hypothetical protein n=1 Tax=Sodalis sp. dw_96 TaxID=2719794 RepID=UPI001BD1C0D7|nr:hypothetical protein [Sodalis sp. dw_96]
MRLATNNQQWGPVIEHALAELVALSVVSATNLVHIKELLPNYMDLMDKRINDDAIITSLMIGFAELDSMLGGNNRQERALLVGRLGMDKIEF